MIGGALAALLSFPGRAMAQGHAVPDDSFVLLLKGLYRPVVKGPNPVPGRYLEGTFELTILEATGIYQPFVGGHNHMVDRLHFLPPGDGSGGFDEYCFCFISRP